VIEGGAPFLQRPDKLGQGGGWGVRGEPEEPLPSRRLEEQAVEPKGDHGELQALYQGTKRADPLLLHRGKKDKGEMDLLRRKPAGGKAEPRDVRAVPKKELFLSGGPEGEEKTQAHPTSDVPRPRPAGSSSSRRRKKELPQRGASP
jgi:hypothetical protein